MRDAITDDFSGVTRDRKYGFCEWNGKRFTVVDTGGFVHGSDDVFESAIRKQVKVAIDESAAIIFMVDAKTGITDLDEEIAKALRRGDKPVFLAVNKVDNHSNLLEANEFWGLGFENTYFIASISGSGTGDLLDAVVEHIENKPELETELPKFAIVGRPNVGKSSLTNALLGEERHIVTPIAGTTRDPIHSVYNKFGKEFMLIDTAGIRKKAKVEEDLEFYSVMRAIRAVDHVAEVVRGLGQRGGVGEELAVEAGDVDGPRPRLRGPALRFGEIGQRGDDERALQKSPAGKRAVHECPPLKSPRRPRWFAREKVNEHSR